MAQSPAGNVLDNSADEYFKGWEALSQLLYEGNSWSGNERHCCFLNLGMGRFADCSAVSGADFADDGRGLAVVDWDGDGDLDVWIANRTGPRIRFLRNDLATLNSFLAVKLTGRSCNRDAIGARLELHLTGSPARRSIKTVRAGEGYLSQSSKWVHFGLETGRDIERLVVRWPGGSVQEFTELIPGQRYEIVEGEPARVRQAARRTVRLPASDLNSPESPSRARVVLSQRQFMPALSYRDFDGHARSLNDYRGRPFLLNVWASWCAPCVQELSDFSKNSGRIKSANLEMIALNFDSVGESAAGDSANARTLLGKLQFPFDSGLGSPQMAETLENGLRHYFDKAGALPLPCSFLVDSSFRVSVIYLGSVSSNQLVKDVALLNASPEEIETAALPFPGRWAVIETGSGQEVQPGSDQNSRLLIVLLVVCFFIGVTVCLSIYGRRARKAVVALQASPSEGEDS